MACTYILYSESLKKNYIGACQESLDDRISAHNSAKYGSHRFTAAASDWKAILIMECDDFNHALRLEKRIKNMKSKTYITNLIKYEEMRIRIIQEIRSV